MTRLREALGAALVLLAAGVAVAGCGGGEGGTTTHARARAAAEKPAARSGGAGAGQCGLRPLVQSLERLEGRLAAGLSYEQYFAEVKGARDTYEAVPVGSLTLPCLTATGTPSEKALDEYIEAANVWRGCRADAACATYSIEPRLQRAWRIAAHYLSEVREGGA